MLLYWGCDPETTPWGRSGQLASRLCYWLSELGIKQVFICPDLNYGAAVHADKWIPILPNTDAALHLAIAYAWIRKVPTIRSIWRHTRSGLINSGNMSRVKKTVLPRLRNGLEPKCGVPSRIIKALARAWASKPTTIAHGNGGPASGDHTPRNRPDWRSCFWRCRGWVNPAPIRSR